jgi:thiol-disulfide isomerase/thioredoxin
MRIRLVLVVFLALAVGACATPQDHAGRAAAAAPATTAVASTTTAGTGPARRPPRGILPVPRRRPAPALRVTALDGRTVSLEGFHGRPVVVNFFASWCPICQAEQPDLSRVARELFGPGGIRRCLRP